MCCCCAFSPRYELLLRELIRNTESSHPDLDALNKELGLVSEVAKHVNEAIRTAQNRTTVLNIQREFSNSELQLVTPSRTFLRKGMSTANQTRESAGAGFLTARVE